jgi:hypothetical protein
MQTFEFIGCIKDGRLTLPSHLRQLKSQSVRVVLLLNEEEHDTRVFANHSAGLIEEWQDTTEDDVWT